MSERNINFWHKVSDKYDNVIDVILGRNIRPYILEKLEQESHLGKSVEFGCGSGYSPTHWPKNQKRLLPPTYRMKCLKLHRII